MYALLTRVDNLSSWKALERVYEDREKASLAADNHRDNTKGHQVRIVWLGYPEDWRK